MVMNLLPFVEKTCLEKNYEKEGFKALAENINQTKAYDSKVKYRCRSILNQFCLDASCFTHNLRYEY